MGTAVVAGIGGGFRRGRWRTPSSRSGSAAPTSGSAPARGSAAATSRPRDGRLRPGGRGGARALKSAGGGPADAVVLATATPDRPCPGTAPDVATRLGLWSAAAFDVAAVCSGFVYALAAGTGLIGAGIVGRVLVIGADVFSSILDPGDRATSVIFGDGAGAVVLRPGEPDEPGALGPFDLGSDGSGADLITVRAAGRGSGCPAPPPAQATTTSRWRQVGVLARRAADGPVVAGGAGPGGWRPDDLDHLVCHQANQRITDHLADELGLPRERALSNIADVGNTAAASIPLALDQGHADGRLREGPGPAHRVRRRPRLGSVTLRWPRLDGPAGGERHG